MRSRAEFRQGALDALPLWLGVVPFGLVYALTARAAGLTNVQASSMSLLVNAGAAQLTAAELLERGAGAAAAVTAAFLVNLRLPLMSGSLAEHVQELSLRSRAGLAFLVVDEAYALAIGRMTSGTVGAPYFVGASASLYLCWQLSTAGGLLAGSFIPVRPWLHLELVFPLSLMVLILPHLASQAGRVAAAAGALAALAAQLLAPGAWYALAGAVAGSVFGTLAERRASVEERR